MARNALGLEFGSAARQSKRPGSVWNCLWVHALRRSLGINRKSRVSYPGTGFLSSATWPSLPKKHYNGLNSIQTKIANQTSKYRSQNKLEIRSLGTFLTKYMNDFWSVVLKNMNL